SAVPAGTTRRSAAEPHVKTTRFSGDWAAEGKRCGDDSGRGGGARRQQAYQGAQRSAYETDQDFGLLVVLNQRINQKAAANDHGRESANDNQPNRSQDPCWGRRQTKCPANLELLPRGQPAVGIQDVFTG